MTIGRDLLGVGLMIAAIGFAVRAVRPPAVLGRAGPAPPCAVAVEIAGAGVRCLPRANVSPPALVSGDRVSGGRMAPDRLAAWEAPVDVNRAGTDELASLDGIGPKLAARIVAARPFRRVEELARVRGIGRRRLARLRPRLVLDERGLDPL
jgi:competence ComEA-like helix-hairpin-helix protein